MRVYYGSSSLLGNVLIGICGVLFTKRIAGGKRVPSDLATNMSGKTVIITGGNTGIGKETAIQLAEYGAFVVIACRNKSKAVNAIKNIKKTKGDHLQLEYMELDLSSFESINKFVASWLSRDSKNIDVLINNAGVMMCPFSRTQEGLELQFGTNHVGHFLLTTSLLPFMNSEGRIINLSSTGHMAAPSTIDWEKIAKDKDSYNPTVSYAISKLANLYFTLELQEILRKSNKKITTFAVHPGVVRTELTRHFNSLMMTMGYPISWLFFKSAKQGAQTSVYCAVAPVEELHPGKFYFDCGQGSPSKQATDINEAKKLWNVTTSLIESLSTNSQTH